MPRTWIFALALALLTAGCSSAPPAKQDGAPDQPAEAEAEAQTETKTAEQSAPVGPGQFEGPLDNTAIEGGKLRLTVKDDYTIVSALTGELDGSRFLVPLIGRVDESTGEFTAEGARGEYTATLDGTVRDGVLKGKMTGSLAGRQVDATFDITQ